MIFLSRKVENLILRVTMNFINLNLVQFFFFLERSYITS